MKVLQVIQLMFLPISFVPTVKYRRRTIPEVLKLRHHLT